MKPGLMSWRHFTYANSKTCAVVTAFGWYRVTLNNPLPNGKRTNAGLNEHMMMNAKCSNMARFWAVQQGNSWLICDRDYADKHIATLSGVRLSCAWHAASYWHIPVSVWREAVITACNV